MPFVPSPVTWPDGPSAVVRAKLPNKTSSKLLPCWVASGLLDSEVGKLKLYTVSGSSYRAIIPRSFLCPSIYFLMLNLTSDSKHNTVERFCWSGSPSKYCSQTLTRFAISDSLLCFSPPPAPLSSEFKGYLLKFQLSYSVCPVDSIVHRIVCLFSFFPLALSGILTCHFP